ncbi:hypothetical protein [Marinifilum caeruleilacunae]|uniref:Uncharacterized protein n=1 Tax=Marinifilum caeruleilacunae TaxID=2499076 RepID=A0ABX1WW46_9BACT|nr:hypothetical protein [Marinifilum caeruleilacunae]NOU60272.1 hypothetical protein [Marinifilum caeruleilacunae]
MYKFLKLLILVVLPCSIYSQEHKTEYTIPIDSVRSIYNHATHTEYDFLIGREYKTYHFQKKHSPIFNGKFCNGTLYWKNRTFKDLLISYDTFKDEIIVRSLFTSGVTASVVLSQNRIDSFAINTDLTTHHFEYLNPEEYTASDALGGYYEIIYQNKLQLVYKHRSRKLVEEGLTIYVPEIHKYLAIDNKLYKINSKQQLFKLFPEKKKMIKQKVSSFQCSYKKLSTSHLVDIIKYLESL